MQIPTLAINLLFAKIPSDHTLASVSQASREQEKNAKVCIYTLRLQLRLSDANSDIFLYPLNRYILLRVRMTITSADFYTINLYD